MRFCCDIGRVICFDDDYGPTDECITSLKELIDILGPDDFYLLSKCKRPMQLQTVARLARTNFYARSGVKPENTVFCQDRTGYGDRPLCLSDFLPVVGCAIDGPVYVPPGYGKGAIAAFLELDGLIDDREECLSDFATGSPCSNPILIQCLFSRWARASRCDDHVQCEDWTSIIDAVRGRVRAAAVVDAPWRDPASESESSTPVPKAMPKARNATPRMASLTPQPKPMPQRPARAESDTHAETMSGPSLHYYDVTGLVMRWGRRGYGFLQPDRNQPIVDDVFVNACDAMTPIQLGDHVMFDVVPGKGRYQRAINCRLVNIDPDRRMPSKRARHHY